MALAEKDILGNRELRQKLMDRLDVLDKVKELVFLPNTELMTVKQVADYYEVGEEAIRTLYFRNKEELESNGAMTLTGTELQKLKTKLQNAILSKNIKALTVFTRRAVLNVGMLLRDSEVAKRVRTYLLDVEEHAPIEVKTKELDEETTLLVNVIKAQTREEFAVAMHEYRQYMLRYKQQAERLAKENNALAKGILTWDARQAINKMMRRFAIQVCYGNFGMAWGKLYDEMLYKHHICVRSRLNNAHERATIFDVLNEDELRLAVKSVVALCKQNNVDISDILFQE